MISKSNYTNGVAARSHEVQFSLLLFLLHYDQDWLEYSPIESRHMINCRFVDDIFVLIKNTEHLPLFLNYMNSKHLKFIFYFKNNKFFFVWVLRSHAQLVVSSNHFFSRLRSVVFLIILIASFFGHIR